MLGSTVSFYIERNGNPPPDLKVLFEYVQPYLYTSTQVDVRIRDVALAMGIKLKEEVAMEDWPMVKCNMSAASERIYHLPMDQQYDRVKICKPGEFYARTVAEAESGGFRRARRWMGHEA